MSHIFFINIETIKTLKFFASNFPGNFEAEESIWKVGGRSLYCLSGWFPEQKKKKDRRGSFDSYLLEKSTTVEWSFWRHITPHKERE